ncbi:MAG: radical SAM protein [Lactococcus chungangensis]
MSNLYLNPYLDFFKYGEKYIMLNYMSGACDIIDKSTYQVISRRKFEALDGTALKCLFNRKYLFQNQKKFQKEVALIDEVLASKKVVPNFLIIPTYRCNLSCGYCFEAAYKITENMSSNIEWIEQCLNSIDEIVTQSKKDFDFNDKDVYITLMGGEPLLAQNYEQVSEIMNQITNHGYSFNVITNGTDLDVYLDELIRFECQSIQITLDGSKEIHDNRRIYKNGNGSYEKIFQNIELALSRNLKIYLRVNLDKDNLVDLPNLAKELLDYFGENDNLVPYVYPMQDGGCLGDGGIIDEIVCIEEIQLLNEKHPQMALFDKKFHASSFMDTVFQNQQFEMKFRNCSATNNQYIFDYKGNIYKCWFDIGNANFKIGTYGKALSLNRQQDALWKNRNIKTLTKCQSCKYRYICGGGCLSHVMTSADDAKKERCIDFYQIIKAQLKGRLAK